ncbi:MAG: sigma-70 family RNA polymerase sigma factor [Planctomycetota bacterium]|nr:sigma-70 family RNA polymerase sigma factor [Planctomycetota bacterium]
MRRERSLEAAIEQSSAKLDAWLAVDDSSPSQKASRIEEVVRLCQALEQLPEAQRIAIERQYFDGQSLEQIGDHLGRSVPAVAGLLRRGLQSLKITLAEDERDAKLD